jgi:holo-[acyl-carrier protein] synthase
VILGVGVDVVDIERMASILERRTSFVARVFTADERDYCESARGDRKRAERYAARFAAKEAAMKALGAGLGAWGFHDVSVVRNGDGAPSLIVVDGALSRARDAGVAQWWLSLSHSDAVATAFVVAESGGERAGRSSGREGAERRWGSGAQPPRSTGN